MISRIFDIDCFKILSIFSVSPGSAFRRNEIKEKTMMNNVPLDKALSRLLNSGIIERKNNFYRINFENEEARKILEIAAKQHKTLKEIPLNVYFLLLDFTEGIRSHKNIEIHLFGSYSKLVYKEKSDVDIAIIHSEGINRKFFEKISTELEKKYSKNIEIHYFEKDSFYKNKKDPLVKDIIVNGIRLI